MNLSLSFIVNQVYIRMQAKKQRTQELQGLVERGLATMDESTGELLIQSESSNRCFLFKVDPVYPFGGLSAVKILLIEVLEEGESLSEWNEKIQGYSSISEIVPLLI